MTVEIEIRFVKQHGRFGRAMESCKPAYMVNVSVRADDGTDIQTMPPQNFEYRFDVVARIHNDCVSGASIAQNRAVALKHSHRDYFRELAD